jgi:C-terminal processing protease CtpA/Prc
MHAHRDYYDDDLEEAFARVIPKAEAARDAAAYAQALFQLASATDDAGVVLDGESFRRATGLQELPFVASWVEGKPIVTRITNDSLARSFDITVGDEITGIDGFPISAWLIEQRYVGPVSNGWTRSAATMNALRYGNGNVGLRIRNRRGAERTITVPRVPLSSDKEDATPATKTIGTGVVYADLRKNGATAAQLRDLIGGDPKTLLLDLRGETVNSIDSIVAPLIHDDSVAIARAITRGSSIPCFANSLREAAEQCADERRNMPLVVTRAYKPERLYSGKVAVLIDERTIGAAERVALLLQRSANAILAGTPSAGAFGYLEWISVPGKLSIGIPVVELRQLDGSQLHRIGLTPSFEARQTVQGVRAGTDDVINSVSQWLLKEANPAPARRR